MDRLPSQRQDLDRAPKLAQAIFAFQKFVVKRGWAFIVLVALTYIGGLLAREFWAADKERLGRELTHYVLIVLGLFAFWIWPKRAKFMKRLVGLLLVIGGGIFAICMLLGANARGWTLGEAWQGQNEYILAPLGQRWLFSGIGLALVMGLGLVVRKRMITKRQARKAGRAEAKAAKPSKAKLAKPSSAKSNVRVRPVEESEGTVPTARPAEAPLPKPGDAGSAQTGPGEIPPPPPGGA